MLCCFLGRIRRLYPMMAFALLFLIVLVNCGWRAEEERTSTSASQLPHQSTKWSDEISSSQTPEQMAHGCPGGVATPQFGSPDVVINGASQQKAVHVQVGQTLEIRFPFGLRWTGPTNSPVHLELQQPAGYAWIEGASCIWRFIARETGETTLSFSEQPLCQPGQFCAQYIRDHLIRVQVQ